MQEITASNQITLFKNACEQNASLDILKKIIEFDVRAIKRHRETCRYLTIDNVDFVLSYGVNPNRSIRVWKYDTIKNLDVFVFARLIEAGLEFFDANECLKSFSFCFNLNYICAIYKKGCDATYILDKVLSLDLYYSEFPVKFERDLLEVTILLDDLGADFSIKDKKNGDIFMFLSKNIKDRELFIEALDTIFERHKDKIGPDVIDQIIKREDLDILKMVLKIVGNVKGLKTDFSKYRNLYTLKLLMKHGLDVNDETFYSNQIVDLYTSLDFYKHVFKNSRRDVLPHLCRAFIKSLLSKNYYNPLEDKNKVINIISFIKKQSPVDIPDIESILLEYNKSDKYFSGPDIKKLLDIFKITNYDNRYNVGSMYLLACVSLKQLQKEIDRGHSLDGTDCYGQTALDIYLETKNLTFAKLLIKNGANMEKLLFSRHITPEKVRFLQKYGIDINAVNDKGENLLFYDLDKVEEYVKLGANINKISNEGKNIISDILTDNYHEKYKVEIIENLLFLGLDVNHITKYVYNKEETETSILFKAVGKNDLEMLNTIKNFKDFNINLRDSKGRNAFYYISYNLEYATIEKLIELGINFNNKDKIELIVYLSLYSKYDLVYKVLTTYEDLIPEDDILIRMFKNIYYYSRDLYIFEDIIKILIKRGLDINYRDKNGETALFEATKKMFQDLVQILINQGIDINILNNDNKNALHYAKYNYSITPLLKSGINVLEESIDNLAKIVEPKHAGFLPKSIQMFEALIKHNKTDILKYYKPYVDVPAEFFMLDDEEYIKRVLDKGDTNILFYLDENKFPFALKYYIKSDLYSGKAKKHHDVFYEKRTSIKNIPDCIALEIFTTHKQRYKFVFEKYKKQNYKYLDFSGITKTIIERFKLDRHEENCTLCEKPLTEFYIEQYCWCKEAKELFAHHKCYRTYETFRCKTCLGVFHFKFKY